MRDFKDKVALVTGAASGIGRALALDLAREGCRLVLADVNEPGLEVTKNMVEGIGRNALALRTDVADANSVKALCEKAINEFGRVDILANVAGIAITADVIDTSLDDWNRILGVNLYGPIHTITYLLNHMIERGSGYIVNVSSGAGLVAVPWWPAYSATKFALVGLTETLRAEAVRHGVGVTVVCPGGVNTGIFDAMQNNDYEIKGAIDQTLRFIGWSPERMSAAIMRGIRWNRPMVVVSISKFGYYMKRLSPGLVYLTQRLVSAYAMRFKPERG